MWIKINNVENFLLIKVKNFHNIDRWKKHAVLRLKKGCVSAPFGNGRLRRAWYFLKVGFGSVAGCAFHICWRGL